MNLYLIKTQLKLIISQRLILGKKVELVPEVLVLDNKSSENGSISIVNSIAKLFVEDKITLKQAKAELDEKDREILHKIIMKMQIKKGKI